MIEQKPSALTDARCGAAHDDGSDASAQERGLSLERPGVGVVRVEVRGPQEARDAPALRGLLRSLLAWNEYVIVDLSEATVDGGVVEALLQERAESATRDGARIVIRFLPHFETADASEVPSAATASSPVQKASPARRHGLRATVFTWAMVVPAAACSGTLLIKTGIPAPAALIAAATIGLTGIRRVAAN
jgi:hypothetical protein